MQYLVQPQLLEDQANEEWKFPSPDDIGHVSFESHLQVLAKDKHTTVHDHITGGAGNLSKTAQYLVVRFGMKPLLHRTVATLSTGEIRKTLLISALCKQPELLILENAMDGLDASSRRELQDIVSKTIHGMAKSGKLLVQAVNANYSPPAQVVMSTHRPEEISPELISTVSYFVPDDNDDSYSNNNNNKNNSATMVTVPRPQSYSNEQIMFMALGMDKDHNKNDNWAIVPPWQDEDPTLPSVEDIRQEWKTEKTCPKTLVSLNEVEIRRRRDGITADDQDADEFATLLEPLSWNIEKGQRWIIAGSNGAGKSTLSRFLLHPHTLVEDQHADASDNVTDDLSSGIYNKDSDTKIGWVSTESHLGHHVVGDDEEVAGSTTAWNVITHNGTVTDSVGKTMAEWVFGDTLDVQLLQDCPLQELSQGQQKLALIASALALKPNLLILDEPTQGLDWVSRRRVLALLERLCETNDDRMSLVYITHYQEEWIPSISHVLHLDKGRALYQGTRKEYNPVSLE